MVYFSNLNFKIMVKHLAFISVTVFLGIIPKVLVNRMISFSNDLHSLAPPPKQVYKTLKQNYSAQTFAFP